MFMNHREQTIPSTVHPERHEQSLSEKDDQVWCEIIQNTKKELREYIGHDFKWTHLQSFQDVINERSFNQYTTHNTILFKKTKMLGIL